MGFDAGASVVPLDWDFTRFGGGKGVSPEPSTRQIEKFFRGWSALQQAIINTKSAALQNVRDLSPDEAKERMLKYAELSIDEAYELAYDELEALADPNETADNDRKMAQLASELTSGCPSVEQIQTLPHRVRAVYYRHLIKEMNDPELFAAATKPSLSVVSGG